ncbi:MAG: glycosyl transferase [Dysgonamonadaceae bacterium]|jgi:hypothetical protein|nr:glycosyl transferase [Dysgonamonadaceae bacterium]
MSDDKKMNKITLVPVGGLANRMRAVAGAFNLAAQTGGALRVIWFRDWALRCPFGDLFRPMKYPNLTVKEANAIDLLTFGRPRLRNGFVPRLFQNCLFDKAIYEREMDSLIRDGFDFASWAKNANVYMATYLPFGTLDDKLYRLLFKPVESIEEVVENRRRSFSDYNVGIHIRRTDNLRSIEHSPIELFCEKMDEEIELHAGVKFYLASDSEKDKQWLMERYGDRIVSSSKEAARNSIGGMKDAVADLYTLASTQKIYGSFGSSFSEMAAQLGGQPLRILKK